MFIKQLSVFIENKEGHLENALKVLKDNNINLMSLSLADTADYGLLRLIVSDPEKGKKALNDNGYTAMLTDVLAIKISHKVGQLQELLTIICQAHVNIEYMYALETGKNDAAIVMKTKDVDAVGEMLAAEGVDFMTEEEINNL